MFASKGRSLHIAMVTLIVFPTFFSMGYSMAFLGNVMSYPVMEHRFQLTTLVQGFVVSLYTLGALGGSLLVVPFGNKFGRRRMTFYGALITLIGTVLQTTSFGIGQLCVGRVLLGIGLGVLSSTLPSWQAETNRSRKRGPAVVFSGLSLAVGSMSASWITFGFSHCDTTKEWTWRVPSLPPTVCMVVVMVFTHAFPESPRLLVLKGKLDEARQTFALLSNDVDPQSESVTYQLEECIRVNELIGEGSLRRAFKWGPEKTPYRVLIALSVMFFTSLSGAGLITYYSNQLFAAIGVSPTDVKIMGSTALTFKALCCLIPFFGIDRIGRRFCFMFASGGMACCMWSLAVCGSQLSPANRTPAYVGAVFAYLFNFFFPIAYDSVNWLYPQEVVSTRYRSAISGLSCSVHWIGNFTVAFATPIGFQSIGYKYYFVWAIISTAAVPIVYFYYPETTGLSMEEIDKVFLESPSVLQTRHTAVKCRREKRETGHVVLEGFGEDSKAEATHCEET